MLIGGVLLGVGLGLLSRVVGARRRAPPKPVVGKRLTESVAAVADEHILIPVDEVLARHRETREHLEVAAADPARPSRCLVHIPSAGATAVHRSADGLSAAAGSVREWSSGGARPPPGTAPRSTDERDPHHRARQRRDASPSQRTGRNGSIFTTFRIATTPYRRSADGRFVDGDTSFYSVIAFNALAANAAVALRKGHPVIVEGNLAIKQYVGSDGQPRTSPEIDADHLGHDLSWGRATFERVSRAAALGHDRTADPDVQASVRAIAEGEPGPPTRPPTSTPTASSTTTTTPASTSARDDAGGGSAAR